MMEISLQWHDGKEKCVEVEALHDKPVAVSSLMEKFPLDFGIIVHACRANIGGGGGGPMTAVKGMVFKQFSLG